MKHYENHEIVNKCKTIWANMIAARPDDYLRTFHECEVRVNTPDRVVIAFSNEYEAASLNSDIFFALAEFFDTKHVDKEDDFSNGGCETCDWGSSYGFNLVVRP